MQQTGTGSDPMGTLVYYFLGVHCCLGNDNYSAMTSTSNLAITDCNATAAAKAANCNTVTGLSFDDEMVLRAPAGYPASQAMPHCFAFDRSRAASAADVGLPRKAMVDFGVTLVGNNPLPYDSFYDVTVGIVGTYRIKAFSFKYTATGTYFDIGVQVDETAQLPGMASVATVLGNRAGTKALVFTNRSGRTCFALTAVAV